MELFDKKYVYFMWDDKLDGKEGFLANAIDQLIIDVNNDNCKSIVSKSGKDWVPFYDGGTPWRFFYYDPNYKYKKAYAEGKLIQIGDGETWVDWVDAREPDWDSVFIFRIKPPQDPLEQRAYNFATTEMCYHKYGDTGTRLTPVQVATAAYIGGYNACLADCKKESEQ